MIITIRYKEGFKFRGKVNFLPLLQVLEKYPFPKPMSCARTNHKLEWLKAVKIKSFTDDKFLKYLDPIRRSSNGHIATIDEGTDEHLNISIQQGIESLLLLTRVSSFLSVEQTKQLFCDLIECEPLWYYGASWTDLSKLYGRYFNHSERNTKTILSWLQYYSKQELEMRGGFLAFESNPYLQTQRIHDGLVVQVGDNPDIFSTPEGEVLLVNAINALPLIKQSL